MTSTDEKNKQRQLFINEAGELVDDRGELISDDDAEAKKELQKAADQVLTAWAKTQIRSKTPAEIIDLYAKIKATDELDAIARAIIDALPEATAAEVLAAANKQANKRGSYITETNHMEGDVIPDKLAIISKKNYKKALDYISLFEAPEETEFDHSGHILTKTRRIETEFDENGNLYILLDDPEATEASKVKLMTAKNHEIIEHFTRQNLDLFFSIISYNIIDGQINKGASRLRPSISLDAYELAEALGTPRSKGTIAINNAIKAVQEFQNFVGVLQNSTGARPSEFAVLQFKKYDRQINRITIESPYITYLIERMYKESLRINAENKIQRDNNGKMLTSAYLSYLPRKELTKERDKAAIENVKIIIVLIEEAGNFTPHKSAREIIRENILLTHRLEEAKDTRRRNILLKRVFTNTWKYLKNDTDLLNVYPGIEIPDTWPTMQNLDIVFSFPNNGKAHPTRK